MEEISKIQALKEYFGAPGYPPVEMTEIKALGMPGVNELAYPAAASLGKKIRAA